MSELETLPAASCVSGSICAPPSVPAAALATDQTQLASESRTDLPGGGPVGPGAVVGRYVVIEEVGRGAMGVVYSAYDPKLDRKVAIKLLIADKRGRRSLGEAQALAKLNHPNVVQVYDAGEFGERVFIAMEFVVGLPLGPWLEQVRPSRAAILDVFRRAAVGLAAAHEAAMVHRDFKPDNMMIAEDGRVLVMDFGLAIVGCDPSASVSVGKFWASGTPAYMSPEQFANEPVGPRSDQFSFCVALYEALVGERPFASDSLASLARAVCEGELRHAAPLRTEAAWLRRLILRGLAVDPEARHPSMDVIAARLESGLGRRRLTIGLSVAGLALTTGLVSWAVTAEQEDPEARACRVEAQALSEAWTGPWRAQARAQFDAQLADESATLWPRVDANIDSFRAAWATTYDQACSARFVARTLETAAYDQRLRCLAEQRAYASGLLDGLGQAQAEDLREIAAVASELPQPASCEAAAHAAGDFDQAAQDQVAAARRGLMRAQGRADAGDDDGARHIAEGTLAALEPIDAPVTESELSAMLARLDYEAGALDSAALVQRRALEAAARSRDPRVLADAWLDRVEHLSTYDRDYVGAATLLEAAEVAVAAAPDDPQLRTALASLRGLNALQSGRHQLAREAFTEAVETAEAAQLGPRTLSVQTRRLGAALAKLGDLPGARAQFERSAELAAGLFGERHTQVVGAYLNLGLLCRQEQDDACARRWLDRALAVAEQPPKRAHILTILGQLEYDEGQLERAVDLANQAVALYEGVYDELHPDLTMPRLLLANVANRRGDVEASYFQAQRLVAIAEASTPAGHPKRALARSTLGEALRTKGELDAALDAHQTALRIRREGLDPGDPRIGYSLVDIANVMHQLEQFAEAEALAREAIEVLDDAPGAERWQADARFVLARSLGPKRAAEARNMAEDALARFTALENDARVAIVQAWLDAHD